MTWAPRFIRKAEVQISQRASNRNVADGGEFAQACHLFLKQIERAADFTFLQFDVVNTALILRQRDFATT